MVTAWYGSTNARGSSGVDPGQSLVSIEIYPSSIDDSLDMLTKSCDCIEIEFLMPFYFRYTLYDRFCCMRWWNGV